MLQTKVRPDSWYAAHCCLAALERDGRGKKILHAALPAKPSLAVLAVPPKGHSHIASLALDGSLPFRALVELSEDGLYTGKG